MQFEDRARIRAAVQRLIDYNWADEEADFRAVPSEDHVFTDLVFLQSWLSEGDVDAAADDAARMPEPAKPGGPWIVMGKFHHRSGAQGYGIWNLKAGAWFQQSQPLAGTWWTASEAHAKNETRKLNEKEARS